MSDHRDLPQQGFFLVGSLRGVNVRTDLRTGVDAAYADVMILPDGYYNSVRVQVKTDSPAFVFLSQLAPGALVRTALSSPRIIPAKVRPDGSQQLAFLGGHLVLGAVTATALAKVA